MRVNLWGYPIFPAFAPAEISSSKNPYPTYLFPAIFFQEARTPTTSAKLTLDLTIDIYDLTYLCILIGYYGSMNPRPFFQLKKKSIKPSIFLGNDNER